MEFTREMWHAPDQVEHSLSQYYMHTIESTYFDININIIERA